MIDWLLKLLFGSVRGRAEFKYTAGDRKDVVIDPSVARLEFESISNSTPIDNLVLKFEPDPKGPWRIESLCRELSRCPGLESVREFRIEGGKYVLPNRAIRWLAGERTFTGLRELDFDPPVSSRGLGAILTSPLMHDLDCLIVTAASGDLDGWSRILSDCDQLSRLRELNLGGSKLGDRRVSSLLPRLEGGRLESLGLTDNALDGSFVEAMLKLNGLSKIRRLRLSFNPIESDLLASLFNSRRLVSLAELDLSSLFSRNRESELQRLCEAVSRLDVLTTLQMGHNDMTVESIESIALAHLPNLRRFDLDYNPIGDRGAELIARAPWVSQLSKLSLCNCDITERGVEAIAASPVRFAVMVGNRLSPEFSKRMRDQFLRDRRIFV